MVARLTAALEQQNRLQVETNSILHRQMIAVEDCIRHFGNMARAVALMSEDTRHMAGYSEGVSTPQSAGSVWVGQPTEVQNEAEGVSGKGKEKEEEMIGDEETLKEVEKEKE